MAFTNSYIISFSEY